MMGFWKWPMAALAACAICCAAPLLAAAAMGAGFALGQGWVLAGGLAAGAVIFILLVRRGRLTSCRKPACGCGSRAQPRSPTMEIDR